MKHQSWLVKTGEVKEFTHKFSSRRKNSTKQGFIVCYTHINKGKDYSKQRRREALDELVAQAQELNMGY